jgi:hypothetical protein
LTSASVRVSFFRFKKKKRCETKRNEAKLGEKDAKKI